MSNWCVPFSDWALGIQVGEGAGYRLQEDGLLIFIPHSDYENRHHCVSNLSQTGRICLDAGRFAQEMNLVIARRDVLHSKQLATRGDEEAVRGDVEKRRADLIKTAVESQRWAIATEYTRLTCNQKFFKLNHHEKSIVMGIGHRCPAFFARCRKRAK